MIAVPYGKYWRTEVHTSCEHATEGFDGKMTTIRGSLDLNEQTPHYAETLNTYRGGDKMMELETFDMEIKTSGKVKALFTKFCLSGNQPSPVPSRQSSEGDIAIGIAGGREAYVALLQWASESLSRVELRIIADILEKGDAISIKKTLLALQERQAESMQSEDDRLF